MYTTSMSRQQWLSIIGIWIMIFLYLGFPSNWDKVFAVCTGLLVVIISFRISNKPPPHSGKEHTKHHMSPFVENADTNHQ